MQILSMHSPPPPANFHPAQNILHAEFTTTPVLRRKRYTGRRLQGVKYEAKMHEYLDLLYGEMYLPSPWIKFFGSGKWRWCQPDGLLFIPEAGRIVIVECKYQHTTDAWWQTRHLYGPVLAHMFPANLWKFEVCEVVKWYDPAVQFPERVVLAGEVHMVHENFKVHIFKP